MTKRARLVLGVSAGASALLLCGSPAPAQSAAAPGWPPAEMLPIEFERSAEAGWLAKPVLGRRVLDDGSDPATWVLTGTGALAPSPDTTPDGGPALRVEVEMFRDAPAPTSNGLSAVTLRRPFGREDWSAFNRLSLWIRPDLSGFPMLPLQVVLRNEGAVRVPDAYGREGIHYVTLRHGVWQRVLWEIEPLARDAVTGLDLGYWVNKLLAGVGDRVAFDVGGLELQRVAPDAFAGWSVGPGRLAFSHAGYQTAGSKVALAGDLEAARFEVLRLDGAAQPEVVLSAAVRSLSTRLGTFQLLDFSAVRAPGRYALRAGDRRTRPFRIGPDVWSGSVRAALNFIFGERCGHVVPGSHGVCHGDWTATHADQRIVMNGGWHDAGDLSQGAVNTGEATYALFALAARLRERGDSPALLAAVIDEGKWGLDWLLRVRFDGGHRVGFAGNNLWTNGVPGDADDRSAEARDDAGVNYIAAAAGALAYRVLRDTEPELAARGLRMAEDDWGHAEAGRSDAETWATPAYATTPMELASMGLLAAMELYDATGARRYSERAVELARVVVASQQKSVVGSAFPLAGFFHTGPDRRTRFHQFHRGNDQAPIVALARLASTFPDHPEWMDWYGVVALHSEYQKAAAGSTQPYAVLPAYVYHESDYIAIPEQAARHQASREAFRAQVLQGLPMGDGYYLRAFPVWFARRGNYGVLLSQAKALSAAAHLRGDAAAADLAQRQAQWVLGLNPFGQSTMYGVGYDWAQQYSVSSGDLVGALPVGMQSHGIRDVPYWPSQNTYVFKEVWIHSVSRWLWLMGDLDGPALLVARVGDGTPDVVAVTDEATGATRMLAPDADGVARALLPAGAYTVRAGDRRTTVTALGGGTHRVDLRPGSWLDYSLRSRAAADGRVTLTVTARGEGRHRLTLRTENLEVDSPRRDLRLEPGDSSTVTWTGRPRSGARPWVAVVVPDDPAGIRLDAFGWPAPGS